MINIIGIRDSGKSKEKISAYLDKITSEKDSEIKEYKAVFQNFGVKNAVHSFLDICIHNLLFHQINAFMLLPKGRFMILPKVTQA